MNYNRPSVKILNRTEGKGITITKTQLLELQSRLEKTLNYLELNIHICEAKSTPISAVFKLETEAGFSMKRFKQVQKEIEFSLLGAIELKCDSDCEKIIWIAVTDYSRALIGLRHLLEDETFVNADSPLMIAAGIDSYGNYVYINLAEAPHMLIEGTTGSGKTIFIDDILTSLIYKSSPEEVRFLLVDPKKVDLMPYDGIQHLMAPVITDADEAFSYLCLIEEMMIKRQNIFHDEGVRDIDGYNSISQEKMYRIVIVLDEYMELITQSENEIEVVLDRIARLGRASGIHIIIASQSSNSYAVSSNIKANIPYRVIFSSATTVKTINGRKRLLGNGDMMIFPSYDMEIHAKASYITFDEIKKVVGSVYHRNIKLD